MASFIQKNPSEQVKLPRLTSSEAGAAAAEGEEEEAAAAAAAAPPPLGRPSSSHLPVISQALMEVKMAGSGVVSLGVPGPTGTAFEGVHATLARTGRAG